MNDSRDNEYNQEPVLFCKDCLSLNIGGVSNVDYCNNCGSTSIESLSIFQWKALYRNAYGSDYLEIKNTKSK